MVAQRADVLLNQLIEFITGGKVDNGTTLKSMRERALPYFIDRGVLMRRVWYRKAEIKVVGALRVSGVFAVVIPQ